MVNSRKKPSFKRWMSQSYARVGDSWRRPRGHSSKIIRHEKGKVRMPLIGWGAKASEKGLHPSGFKEVFVSSVNDLQKIDVKVHAARISATVGKKKRAVILKKAEELKIKVLNPGSRVKENA